MTGGKLGVRFEAALVGMAFLSALAPARTGAQELTVGVKGGLNSSNLSADDPDDPEFGFDSRTGLRIGAFVQVGLSRNVAIQPEVSYSRKGAKPRGSDTGAMLYLDYVEIPVLLSVRPTSRESPVDPVLYAGPQVSVATNCRVRGEEEGAALGVACDSPLPEGAIELAKTDFGLVFGGGFEILFNRLTVQLDVRYNLGLTNLNESAGAADVSVRSRTWSFMAGAGVPIG